jgi:prevent-host-death family protein
MRRSKEGTGPAKKSQPPRLSRLVFDVRSALADSLGVPQKPTATLPIRFEEEALGVWKVREGYGRIGLVKSTSQNVFMREIQASDAKARLLQLLDDVERGETLIITRRGRAIARIVPEVNRRQEEVDRALASIRELRKRTRKVTLDEILSAKEEGRKY